MVRKPWQAVVKLDGWKTIAHLKIIYKNGTSGTPEKRFAPPIRSPPDDTVYVWTLLYFRRVFDICGLPSYVIHCLQPFAAVQNGDIREHFKYDKVSFKTFKRYIRYVQNNQTIDVFTSGTGWVDNCHITTVTNRALIWRTTDNRCTLRLLVCYLSRKNLLWIQFGMARVVTAWELD